MLRPVPFLSASEDRYNASDRTPQVQHLRGSEVSRRGGEHVVEAWVFGGGPVFLKLGRRVVYERADLDAWTQRHRRLSTSDPGSADLHADPISSDRSRSAGPPNGLPTPEIRAAEFLD